MMKRRRWRLRRQTRAALFKSLTSLPFSHPSILPNCHIEVHFPFLYLWHPKSPFIFRTIPPHLRFHHLIQMFLYMIKTLVSNIFVGQFSGLSKTKQVMRNQDQPPEYMHSLFTAKDYETKYINKRNEYNKYLFKLYKTVDKRVKPVKGVMPEEARVRRTFPENPLDSLPPLPMHPPEFTPTTKLTQERLESMKINDGFLWPKEEKLFAHVFKLNERALAFEEVDRGTLRQ